MIVDYVKVYQDVPNAVEQGSGMPAEYHLYQNYPNPFNPSTTIRYSLPESGEVTVKVFNMLGKEIATLVNGRKSSGDYKVDFNAANISSGMYFYSIRTENYYQVRKMVLLK